MIYVHEFYMISVKKIIVVFDLHQFCIPARGYSSACLYKEMLMKLFAKCQNSCFRRLFNINIVSGLLLAACAYVLMISSDYANIAERKSWDAIYNMVILGGVIYAIIFWYMNTFARQWFVQNRKQ